MTFFLFFVFYRGKASQVMTSIAQPQRNMEVTLIATPKLFRSSIGWRGSSCGGNRQCTITMDGEKRWKLNSI
jgi:hypothetical protein